MKCVCIEPKPIPGVSSTTTIHGGVATTKHFHFTMCARCRGELSEPVEANLDPIVKKANQKQLTRMLSKAKHRYTHPMPPKGGRRTKWKK